MPSSVMLKIILFSLFEMLKIILPSFEYFIAFESKFLMTLSILSMLIGTFGKSSSNSKLIYVVSCFCL